MIDRAAMLRSKFHPAGLGLEIGPSHQPTFPKAQGFTVETLDYTTGDELRRRFAELGADASVIEDPDYISDGRSVHEVIDQPGRYDFIFSSHVIEHMPDFVGFLESCEVLLKPGGVVGLAAPDKRYTFDAVRQLSTTGQVLQSHHYRRTRHTPWQAFDFVADFVTMDARDGWHEDDRGALADRNNVTLAKGLFDDAIRPDAPYHDIHGWVFTPNSFRLILQDLHEAGMTRLRENRFAESGGIDFFVELSFDGKGSGMSRLELQQEILRENVLHGLRLLAPDRPEMAAALEMLEPAGRTEGRMAWDRLTPTG